MLYHVTERRLLNDILTQGLMPKIGGRSELIGESIPAIYLFPDMESCDNALLNWLGESYEELPEDALVILQIDDQGLSLSDDVEFERISYDPLPPERIKGVLGEDYRPITLPFSA